MHFFRTIYFFIYLVLYRIQLAIGILKIKERDVSEEDRFIQERKMRFIKLFEEENLKKTGYNENIEAAFYQKQVLLEILKDPKNKFETEWKTRILYDSSPRGNIIMYYDPYKLGFSYYCDQKTVSYDILNAIAMKYVDVYRCIHFFLDENIVPKEKGSPLIDIYFKEKEESKEKRETKQHFIKRKTILKEISNGGEPEKIQNKFIYLGKVANFQWIQPFPKKRKVLARFTSPLLENIIKESGIQRETLTYSDFKNKMKSSNIQDT